MVEIHEKTKLLDDNGQLNAKGFAKSALIEYNRENLKGKKLRLKEWDFYQISSTEFCMQMTIGHVSYMGNFNCTVFDFKSGQKISINRMIPFPNLKKLAMNLSAAEKGVQKVTAKDFEMSFEIGKGFRHLKMKAVEKPFGEAVVDVMMLESCKESMVIATPFEKKAEFYLNQKINLMPTSGFARFGSLTYNFNTKKNFALLDWGRGVWPFSHEWYWGNGSGSVDGKPFGFNIGWGFGDTSAATENMLFYDGKGYKIDQVIGELDTADYMKPWKFTSNDGAFEMNFTPTYDNHTQTKVLFVNNECHQVFGKFDGTCKVGETTLEIKDFFAFCEHAVNHW